MADGPGRDDGESSSASSSTRPPGTASRRRSTTTRAISTSAGDFEALHQRLRELEGSAASRRRVYYLATAPQFYEETVVAAGRCGLADESHGPRRIVIEKPFGTDLATARELNDAVHRVFRETQVYRIDHYLGKETVQNILVLRFANTIFEPIWNRNYIDHVQITVAEEVTVGRRGGYYDKAGVLRDMFQNHLLQLLMITAMEVARALRGRRGPRRKGEGAASRSRRCRRRTSPRDTLRGQYRGYRHEPGVAPDSQTATFAAVQAGDRQLALARRAVLSAQRQGHVLPHDADRDPVPQPPHMVFHAGSRNVCEANRLVIQIQPAEGIQLHFQTKVPDAGMKLRLTDLEFSFQREFARRDARGLRAAAARRAAGRRQPVRPGRRSGAGLGDHRSDPGRLADDTGQPTLEIYEPGLWGPEDATDWMERQGRQWFDACPVLA